MALDFGSLELELAAVLENPALDEIADDDAGLELLEYFFALLDEDFDLLDEDISMRFEKCICVLFEREKELETVSLDDVIFMMMMISPDELDSSCALAMSSLHAVTMLKIMANI